MFSLLFHGAKAEEGTEMRMVKEEKRAGRKKPLRTINPLLSPRFPGARPEPFLSLRPRVFASRNDCGDPQERVTSFSERSSQRPRQPGWERQSPRGRREPTGRQLAPRTQQRGGTALLPHGVARRYRGEGRLLLLPCGNIS